MSQVLNKQHEILTKMTEEISMLDQIATCTIKLNLSLATKISILRALKTECVFMVLQILGRKVESFKNKPTEDINGRINHRSHTYAYMMEYQVGQ